MADISAIGISASTYASVTVSEPLTGAAPPSPNASPVNRYSSASKLPSSSRHSRPKAVLIGPAHVSNRSPRTNILARRWVRSVTLTIGGRRMNSIPSGDIRFGPKMSMGTQPPDGSKHCPEAGSMSNPCCRRALDAPLSQSNCSSPFVYVTQKSKSQLPNNSPLRPTTARR